MSTEDEDEDDDAARAAGAATGKAWPEGPERESSSHGGDSPGTPCDPHGGDSPGTPCDSHGCDSPGTPPTYRNLTGAVELRYHVMCTRDLVE